MTNSIDQFWDSHEVLYVQNRGDWRAWLQENYLLKEEIWLLYPKKATGKPRILYNDAVEEALCFGWIDSIVKTYDDEFSSQRFSLRKSKTNFSRPNIERLRWLRKENLLLPSVERDVSEIIDSPFIFPDDIIDRIKTNKEAWENYKNFSDGYKRIRIAYIEAARKRPEEYEKRLKNFINKTEENKQIGFGGIEKYY